MTIALALVISLLVIAVVLAPMLTRRGGGLLEETSFVDDPQRLETIRQTVLAELKTYQQKSAQDGLSSRTIRARIDVLVNRYVDATRRLDFLKYSIAAQSSPKGGEHS